MVKQRLSREFPITNSKAYTRAKKTPNPMGKLKDWICERVITSLYSQADICIPSLQKMKKKHDDDDVEPSPKYGP